MAQATELKSAEAISAAIDRCDEGTLRRLLQTVIRKVPECRRKIAEDANLSAELYQVSEEERQKATADQYSEKVISEKVRGTVASDAVDFCERAKFVPMRLTYDERKYLRLIDATMHVGRPRGGTSWAPVTRARGALVGRSSATGMPWGTWSLAALAVALRLCPGAAEREELLLLQSKSSRTERTKSTWHSEWDLARIPGEQKIPLGEELELSFFSVVPTFGQDGNFIALLHFNSWKIAEYLKDEKHRL
ncbi:UPF0652 protein, partial [Durusdinium trenchii]